MVSPPFSIFQAGDTQNNSIGRKANTKQFGIIMMVILLQGKVIAYAWHVQSGLHWYKIHTKGVNVVKQTMKVKVCCSSNAYS